MGITSWDDRRRLGPAMSLGGAEVRALELTSAYTVFANNGLRIQPVAITRIVDADGNEIESYRVPQGEQVVDPRYAYMITSILSGRNARLVTFGPNSLINLPARPRSRPARPTTTATRGRSGTRRTSPSAYGSATPIATRCAKCSAR